MDLYDILKYNNEYNNDPENNIKTGFKPRNESVVKHFSIWSQRARKEKIDKNTEDHITDFFNKIYSETISGGDDYNIINKSVYIDKINDEIINSINVSNNVFSINDMFIYYIKFMYNIFNEENEIKTIKELADYIKKIYEDYIILSDNIDFNEDINNITDFINYFNKIPNASKKISLINFCDFLEKYLNYIFINENISNEQFKIIKGRSLYDFILEAFSEQIRNNNLNDPNSYIKYISDSKFEIINVSEKINLYINTKPNLKNIITLLDNYLNNIYNSLYIASLNENKISNEEKIDISDGMSIYSNYEVKKIKEYISASNEEKELIKNTENIGN